MHTRTFQCSVVSRVEIDKAYSDLLHSVEEFLVELRSRQEQQRIKDEEEEKLRKIREEEVGKVYICDQFLSVTRQQTYSTLLGLKGVYCRLLALMSLP